MSQYFTSAFRKQTTHESETNIQRVTVNAQLKILQREMYSSSFLKSAGSIYVSGGLYEPASGYSHVNPNDLSGHLSCAR